MELNYPLDLRHLAQTFPWRLFYKRMEEDFLVGEYPYAHTKREQFCHWTVVMELDYLAGLTTSCANVSLVIISQKDRRRLSSLASMRTRTQNVCSSVIEYSAKRLSSHRIYDILRQRFRGDCFTEDKCRGTPRIIPRHRFWLAAHNGKDGRAWCWLMKPTPSLYGDKAIAVCCIRRPSSRRVRTYESVIWFPNVLAVLPPSQLIPSVRAPLFG